MSSAGGTTTVTQAGSRMAGVGAHGLTLVWRFPRASEPPVGLDWEGGGELVVGRDATSAVHLEGHDVSRRHASLRRNTDGAGAMIEDLGSRNGTYVGGERISKVRRLENGDKIKIGGASLVFRCFHGLESTQSEISTA